MEKVWKDFNFRWLIILFGQILLSLILIYAVVKENAFEKYKIIIILISLVPLFMFFNLIRIKLTYITSDGIGIGNAKNFDYSSIFLTHKPTFLKWKSIKNIKIVGKEYRGNFGIMWKIHILTIRTKDGKNFECYLAKPEGFVANIHGLGEGKLFSKDSEFRELLW